MKTFYTYLYLREDGTPYYVGKGHGKRAYNWHGKMIAVPKDRNRISITPAESEESAFQTEKTLIKLWGRKNNETGILRNKTDGGEGNSGYIPSEESKRKNSLAHTGMKRPPFTKEHRRKMSEAHKGNRLSVQAKEKKRQYMLGRKLTNQHRNAISKGRLGMKFSDKHKENLRNAWKSRRLREQKQQEIQ